MEPEQAGNKEQQEALGASFGATLPSGFPKVIDKEDAKKIAAEVIKEEKEEAADGEEEAPKKEMI